MFDQLDKINTRPEPFEFYTARDLWTDDHTSEQMLKFHLDDGIDASSRNAAFIDRSAGWIASRFDIGAGRKIADFGCGPGLYGFLNTFKYNKEKLVLDKYTIIEASRTRTVYNWLQHFSPEDLEREFGQCGFAVESFYSDVAGTPFTPASREFAVVAKKI